MTDWIVRVILGVIGVGLLAALVCWLVSFCRKTPEERKETVVQFLIGLVTVAENAFTEGGKGAEKLAMVEESFNRVAPWFMKIMLKLSGAANLQELIEVALERAKTTWMK